MQVQSGGFSGSAATTLGPTAPAPAAAPQGQQSHLRVVQPSHHQGQPEPDYREAFAKSQKELDELRGKHGETTRTLEQLRKKSDGAEQTLNRLRQVFVPDEGNAPDPVEAEVSKLEQALDYYIQKGFEAEKAGSPIPLTVDNAIRQIQHQIASLRKTSQLENEVAQLKKQLGETRDPNRQLDGTAYQQMDGFLINALNTLYGPGDDSLMARNSAWTANIQQLKAEVQNLQQNHPDIWDKARRNPQQLQRMVNHVVTQSLPPRARQIVETERLRNTPITERELWAAHNEARAKVTDPKEREKTLTQIRRAIWAEKWNSNRGSRRR